MWLHGLGVMHLKKGWRVYPKCLFKDKSENANNQLLNNGKMFCILKNWRCKINSNWIVYLEIHDTPARVGWYLIFYFRFFGSGAECFHIEITI